MRFVKSVQIAIGFAAAGGAAVALNGAAWAAESGSSPSVPTVQSVSDQVKNVIANTAAGASGSTAGTVAGAPDQHLMTRANPIVNGASSAPGSPVSGPQKGGVSTVSNNPSDGSVKPGDSSLAPSNSDQPAGQSNVINRTVSSSGSTSRDVAPASSDPADGMGSQGVNGIGLFVGSGDSVSSGSGEIGLSSIVFRSVRLPIQRVITSRSMPVAEDLAANVASAPQSTKAPVPSKSNGMLGRLTALLAATVVPQPLPSGVLVARQFAGALGLGVLAVLLVRLFVTLTYGLWLRKGGFATAARSDADAHGVVFSLVAISALGYALVKPFKHSPFFVVIEQKEGAL
jgi:hypothetical protein